MAGTHSYGKYPKEYDFGGAKVLNLGCGFAKYQAKNVVNLDAFDVCKPDVVHDLNKFPLPFPDETFDLVFANHVLEHIQDWWGCFNELARITKTGGQVEVWLPGSGSDSVRGYRDHLHEINHCSFYGVFGTYRSGGNAWAAEAAKCNANRLKLYTARQSVNRESWMRFAPQRLLDWCAAHLRNIVQEQGYFFVKISKEDHEREMSKFNERLRTNSLIPV